LSQANELVYDRELHRCYLLIPKNGTRSLHRLVLEDPLRFLYFSGSDASQFLQKNNITELTVFVRDPIERFFSGLTTQSLIYNFDINVLLNLWENGQGLWENGQGHYNQPRILIFDEHTVPQFWFLLRATNISNLKFNIVPLDHLSIIYPHSEKVHVGNTKKTNVSKKFDFSNVASSVMTKIDYYFTEDIVLHSQFQNKVVDLETIISQIRLEKTFTEEYRSYYKMLTYL
jgi:hypothetical protein